MLEKQNFKCNRLLETGPFYQEYLVQICRVTEDKLSISKKVNNRRYIDNMYSSHMSKEEGDAYRNDMNMLFRLRAMNKNQIIRQKIDEEMVMNEVEIRSNIRHNFLVNQITVFQDYDMLFYLTEYAPLKLLNNNILPLRLDLNIVRFYGAEIFCCLKYLHSKNIVYTLLLPDNILLGKDGHIKLDFSFCNGLNTTNITDDIEYASLEYIVKNKFTVAGDFWSFGIILYKMVIGRTPFGGDSYEETIDNMLKGDLEFPYFIEDVDFINLVSILLDRKMRLGASKYDYELIMGHPFFINIDWESIEKKMADPPYIPECKVFDDTQYPTLDVLYTTDYIVGDKDGYGSTFSNYNNLSFIKKE